MRTTDTDGADTARARKPRRWLRICFCLLVAIVVALLVCAIGTATGTLVVPVPGLSLYSTLGIALLLAWFVIAVAASGRKLGVRGRCLRLLYAAACLLVIVAAGYFVWWRPMRTLHNYWLTDERLSPDELRRLSHRSLLVGSTSAAFDHLCEVGDESSVPYVIWAMGWRVSVDGDATRCWGGYDVRLALKAITNNSPGDTQYAWARWYRDNKHGTRMQWWADGFTAEGYPVSPAGGEKSIRSLLAVLGRTPLYQHEPKRWLAINAQRMLRALDADAARAVLDEVLVDGTVEQRRGLARYAGRLGWEWPTGGPDRREPERLLFALLRDKDRSVRLRASRSLCMRQLEWLKNPSGSVLRPSDTDGSLAQPGKDVIVARGASQCDSRKWAPRAELEVVPGAAGAAQSELPACVIRIDSTGEYEGSAEISLVGRVPDSERAAYTRHLITTGGLGLDDICWIFDAGTNTLYVSLFGYTCAADPRTGRIRWEMGYGTDDGEELYLLGPYLAVDSSEGLVICDAIHGGILANYDLDQRVWDDRLTLVHGQIRISAPATGDDSNEPGRCRYVLKAPKLSGHE